MSSWSGCGGPAIGSASTIGRPSAATRSWIPPRMRRWPPMCWWPFWKWRRGPPCGTPSASP
eukprot:11504829-Alexandrium_andersonii.AAC.1